jgi:hypothetical protein
MNSGLVHQNFTCTLGKLARPVNFDRLTTPIYCKGHCRENSDRKSNGGSHGRQGLGEGPVKGLDERGFDER